jgi:hypothetical protein
MNRIAVDALSSEPLHNEPSERTSSGFDPAMTKVVLAVLSGSMSDELFSS